MPDWGREDTLDKARTGSKAVFVAVTGYALGGALSRLLGRRREPGSEVDRAVREVRQEMGRGRESVRKPQPTAEQVRARREERRRREAEETRS